jgi:hypothetical protein
MRLRDYTFIVLGVVSLFVLGNVYVMSKLDDFQMAKGANLLPAQDYSSINQGNVRPENLAKAEHRVAGLSCGRYGGPSDDVASEMVYWRDIRSDESYSSPLAVQDTYLTFEPDEGGWNNIRMALENAVMMAIMTGRTLVLPPSQNFYLLGLGGKKKHKKVFGFADFFHFESVQQEHKAFKAISFEEFLERVAMKGHLKDSTGKTSFPPMNNRTDWNDLGFNHVATKGGKGKVLWGWLRTVTTQVEWTNEKCVATFPSELGPAGVSRMQQTLQEVWAQDAKKFPKINPNDRGPYRIQSYENKPTPVDAPVAERLGEMMADRGLLCMYDERLQNAEVVHLKGEYNTGRKCEY